MSESSSLSELEPPPSSDSLDTLIGLATETGRTTVATPSSSSGGIAASSDAVAASSDSSRPRTPRQHGDPSSVYAGAPSSGGAGNFASTGVTGHHTEEAQIARGKSAAPNPAVNLLELLRQIQEQQLLQQQQQRQYQLQQQQVLAALVQQVHLGRAQTGPGAAASPPDPQSTEQAPPTLEPDGPRREGPGPPPQAPHLRQVCSRASAHLSPQHRTICGE